MFTNSQDNGSFNSDMQISIQDEILVSQTAQMFSTARMVRFCAYGTDQIEVRRPFTAELW